MAEGLEKGEAIGLEKGKAERNKLKAEQNKLKAELEAAKKITDEQAARIAELEKRSAEK